MPLLTWKSTACYHTNCYTSIQSGNSRIPAIAHESAKRRRCLSNLHILFTVDYTSKAIKITNGGTARAYTHGRLAVVPRHTGDAFQKEKRRKIVEKKLKEASEPAYMHEILNAEAYTTISIPHLPKPLSRPRSQRVGGDAPHFRQMGRG